MKRALIGLVTFALGVSLVSAETKKCTLDDLIYHADKNRQEMFASDIKTNIIGNKKAFLINETLMGRDGIEISGDVFYITEFDENKCKYRTAHIGNEVFAKSNFVWSLADQEKMCVAVLNITKGDARGDIEILDDRYGMIQFMNGNLMEFRTYDLNNERKVIPIFSAKFDSAGSNEINIDKLIERVDMLNKAYQRNGGASFYVTPEFKLSMGLSSLGDFFDDSRIFGVYNSDNARIIITLGGEEIRIDVEVGLKGKYYYAGYAIFGSNYLRKETSIRPIGFNKSHIEGLLKGLLDYRREYPLFFESINFTNQEKI
ncbi:hypothetical protein J4468_02010 [Candidatus Woesearchaeota archaeon]|nr:hypothetical protein [Candidatus Woesearchaeota archaeon]